MKLTYAYLLNTFIKINKWSGYKDGLKEEKEIQMIINDYNNQTKQTWQRRINIEIKE